VAEPAPDDRVLSPLAEPMGMRESRQLDDIDREIVRLLQRDGRMSNTDMGRALGVTETTVRKRVSRLLDDGIMTVVAVPSPAALGMTVAAIFGISVQLGALNDVCQVMRADPEVRYIAMSTGRYDVLIEAFFATQNDLLEFMTNKLGSLAGVQAVEASMVLRVVKFSYEWEIA
jgi:Lrp/AsnC family transcriptional regulator for asnA, asnC and gidA